MSRNTLDRRTMLKTMAVGAASVAIAGCSSGGSSGDGDDGGDAGDDSNGKESGGGDSGGESVDFDGWFDDVGNYDGVVDETGSSEATVKVGAKGNNGAFGFGPAAVAVSSGTTVVWEWTGDGGAHNVAAENGDFESETVSEQGHTFEHTFDSAGTYEYVCVPHEAMGMKGAIVVK